MIILLCKTLISILFFRHHTTFHIFFFFLLFLFFFLLVVVVVIVIIIIIITPIIIVIISILSFVLFDMKRAAVGGKDKVQHGGVHKGQQLSCLIKITPSCVRSQLQEVADCKKNPP